MIYFFSRGYQHIHNLINSLLIKLTSGRFLGEKRKSLRFS